MGLYFIKYIKKGFIMKRVLYLFAIPLIFISCQINNSEDKNLQASKRVVNKDYILILSGVPSGMCETLHCDSIKCDGSKSLFPQSYKSMSYQEVNQEVDCNFFDRANNSKNCKTVNLGEGSSSCAYGFNSENYNVKLDELDDSTIDTSKVLWQIESN